jgi:hypothetical protein
MKKSTKQKSESMYKNTPKKNKYLRIFKKIITLKEHKNLPKKQKFKTTPVKIIISKKM